MAESIFATPEMVACYLAAFAGRHAVATLCRRLVSIRKAHSAQCYASPTDTEIENIKLGLFRIYRIDVNKALLFDDKQKAQQYLSSIKEHGTYPRRDREVENNGIYFGKGSKRTTLLYYFKGQEIRSHNKQQTTLTTELREYADRMIRCEVRLFNQADSSGKCNSIKTSHNFTRCIPT